MHGARAPHGSHPRNRPPVVTVYPNLGLDTPLVRCRIDHTAAGQPALELRNLQGQLEAHSTSDVMAMLGEVDAAARRGWYAAGFVAYEAAPAFDSAFRVIAPSPQPTRLVRALLRRVPCGRVATSSGQANHRREVRC
jgi:hypothetical protein